MKIGTRVARLVVVSAGWLCVASGMVWAQAPALAPGQVPGNEIQAWLEADGFAVGGINLANGCYFLARGAGKARTQSIQCVNMAPFSVTGEGKVSGNQFCSKFDYPDGTKVDRCLDVVKVGENKYELRTEGRTTTLLYRLVR